MLLQAPLHTAVGLASQQTAFGVLPSAVTAAAAAASFQPTPWTTDAAAALAFFTSTTTASTAGLASTISQSIGESFFYQNNANADIIDFHSVLDSSHHSLMQAVAFVPMVQHVGENIFAAALVVAVLQAAVAMFTYASNPIGTLVIPPGLTIGVEVPVPSTCFDSITMAEIPSTSGELNPEDWGLQENEQEKKGFSGLIELFNPNCYGDGESKPQIKDVVQEKIKATASMMQSRYARFINRANRMLPVLLPFLTRNLSALLIQNAHLFHIGFITALIKIFDFPTRFIQRRNINVHNDDIIAGSLPRSKTIEELSRVCVIGDSLAVGLGSVNAFDVKGPQPYYRIEHLTPTDVSKLNTSTPILEIDKDQPPEFPRAFARSLASHRNAPVSWRSAGVDGGTVNHISEFCKGVVEEEVAKNSPPDVVVIICGANDLKAFIAHPMDGNSARRFRNNLTKLIVDIRKLSPGTKIILPALPTQVFHKNSPLNVFPLGMFIDTIAGFWDSQKKLVADQFPSDDVMYAGVSAADVRDWYAKEDTLISADGVHPNRQCYALWAKTVVDKFCDALPSSRRRQSEQSTTITERSGNLYEQAHLTESH